MSSVKHHKNTIKYIFTHLFLDVISYFTKLDRKHSIRQWISDNKYLLACCIGSLLICIYKTYTYMYSADPNIGFVYNVDIYLLNFVIICLNLICFVLICYIWKAIFYFCKKLKKFYKHMMKEANEN